MCVKGQIIPPACQNSYLNNCFGAAGAANNWTYHWLFFYNFYKFLISWKLLYILSDTHGPALNWKFLLLNMLCFKYFQVFLFCLNPKGYTSAKKPLFSKENNLRICSTHVYSHSIYIKLTFPLVLKFHLQDQYFIWEPYNIFLENSFQTQPLQFLLYLLQILLLPPDLFKFIDSFIFKDINDHNSKGNLFEQLRNMKCRKAMLVN